MAVTYYNQTVLGGTSYPRYADPLVTGKSNADGLYPWSTVRARFASYSAGEVNLEGDFSATDVHLLLFSSDIPAVGYLAPASTGLSAATVQPTSRIGISGASAFFRATPGGTDVTVAAGQVGVGYVYNAGATTDADKNIYVAGFPATSDVPGGPGSISKADLWIWSNSPNICSPVSFQNWNDVVTATAATSGALPIVLLYTSYTQAIRDAGNIIVNTTGTATGATYQVIGLYSSGKG